MKKEMDDEKGFISDEVYYKKHKVWKHEIKSDKNKNLSLKGYLKYFILNCSELVYQLRESFDAWNINPVNRVVFTSSTETDEYRDLYLNWWTNIIYYREYLSWLKQYEQFLGADLRCSDIIFDHLDKI